MMRSGRLVVGFMLFLGLVTPASAVTPRIQVEATAEQQAQNFARSSRDAVYRTWKNRLKPAFTPYLEVHYPGLVDRIQFEVVDYADFNAISSGVSKKIILPMGIILGIIRLSDAAAIASLYPKIYKDKFGKYLEYVADGYLDSAKAGHMTLANSLDFASFVGMPKAERMALGSTEKFETLYFAIIVDSLALVIGHEIGHIALQHKSYKFISAANSRKQERQADAFAQSILDASDIPSIFGVLTVFLFFAEIEASAAPTSHPPASCRMLFFLNHSLNQLSQDPNAPSRFVANIRQAIAAIPKVDCEH
ncbi:phage exclusion protein Lit family protein [Burkholderia stagnalis]|uniref:phage exclusion protein Lit family protein n=1 Tax=Burkholderia stagnalis TaxID=1503054 RepID=UPI000B08FF59|nr:phage exclusion protein Lit family protein [Burkholderia stagnalis]